MAQTNAQNLCDIISYQYSPWWHGLEPKRGGLQVTHDTESGDEGAADGSTFVTTAVLNAAIKERRLSGQLCCARDIASEGLGYGCAEDADQILQQAVFGKQVFS